MKKFSTILLILCMTMSMVTAVPTFAEEVTTLTIEDAATSELINGFYDNSGAEEPAIQITNTGYAGICHGGEWISYDISSLKAGTYSVSVTWKNKYGKTLNNAGLDFIVDDVLELRSYTPAESTDPEENKLLGNIYVPEGARELKIKNNGFAMVHLKAFTLTFVGAEDTSSNIVISAQNATSVVGSPEIATTSFALGTDYYDAKCDAYNKDKGWVVACTSDICSTHSETKGYHYAFTDANIIAGDSLQHHMNDWTRYDISDLKPGYYDVKFLGLSTRNNGTPTHISMSLGTIDNVVISKFLVEPTELTEGKEAVFGPAYDAEAGTIYIPENTTYMYLYNQMKGAYYVSGIELERLNMAKIDKNTEVVSFYAHDESLLAPKTEEDFVIYEPSGEWISYDISSFEAGTYDVTVDYVSDAIEERKMRGLDFVVDGNLELRSYLARKITSSSAEVGKIYLPEGAEELKIKNHGFYQIKVKSVSLKYVGEEDTSEDITISAQNATSSYIDGAAKSILLEDYFDNSCKSEAVAKKQDQASTAHLAEGATCYHYPFTHTAVATGEYVQHNPGEWTRYDISDLKPGFYDVKFLGLSTRNNGTATQISMSLGTIDNVVISNFLVEPTDLTEGNEAVFGPEYDAEAGTIRVPENTTYMYLYNQTKGAYNVSGIELERLNIEYTPDETTILYSSDAEGENAIDSLDGLSAAYVTANLVRPSKPEAIAETIVVALYDGSKLESIIEVTPVTVGYEFSETYEVTGLSDLTEPTIKVFVWDSLTGMDPVISNAPISISYES